ncbi:septum-promoting GTP-binding protein 1-like isoform X2 [Salvia splendens]|uniref:septum-promoting GTP-binding protein 1-like isoform X2 n=1 Tax=Salvia splendens TaxID=180675 RepID=UPI001C25FF78|nr:septum-promoting GTP-binding protein 1-like isoform X2 [Salvia splendens]
MEYIKKVKPINTKTKKRRKYICSYGAGEMTHRRLKLAHVSIRWRVRQFLNLVCDRILVCSLRMPYPRYTRLSVDSGGGGRQHAAAAVAATTSRSGCCESDSDLVSLKITMLGDPEIGKTTFLVKYVGDEEGLEMKEVNVNVMDKTMCIQGEKRSFDQVPIACKNAAAILFMFDLTSRRTLNSVIGWYSEARKWNQTAVPIIIGTKFDDFMQLPLDIQWTVVTQARRYAKAINAALFFSSAKYNINVNKMFKFIMAKIFNLPWTLHRNLTIGEPIIDF